MSLTSPIDEYIAGLAEPARTTLAKVCAAIRAAVPEATEEAIVYRMPGFKYKGPLIGFLAHPKHCALYLMSGGVLDGFRKEVAAYETAKGTIRFPLDKPLPAVLIRKLVKARIAENEALKSRKKAPAE
ncbi:MAG: DUF1801 domain-containing protein [Acidobacteria bacterium]|nr:DUF1801 domain-containing protein [Acidobacteriota bacterium]